ncbi:Flp family type IVb pilin [Cryobacterium sp. TMT1-2-1]|uniref:Flp family type IVb pilin n=1 Tax=Cryobacterium sp. TMT1-2-1 TaxID=1259232 RepID=UPI00106C90DD|nr:Flp family type IVb pilin [Cryobacterium sp. TMT1-2-1]TFD43787.1 Flp family type IVb pilin [Cryobacterium sp. TMT1-2-1]
MRTILDILASRLRHADDRERGATAVEYALMVSLIALVIFGAAVVFGAAVTGMFGEYNASMP